MEQNTINQIDISDEEYLELLEMDEEDLNDFLMELELFQEVE